MVAIPKSGWDLGPGTAGPEDAPGKAFPGGPGAVQGKIRLGGSGASRGGCPASFTVEAALVMPLVLGAVFFVILYTFLLHDRVTAEAWVWEEAEQRQLYPEEEREGALAEGEPRLLWTPVQEISVRQEGRKVEVFLQSGTAAAGLGRRLSFQAVAKRTAWDPVSLLRLCSLLLE